MPVNKRLSLILSISALFVSTGLTASQGTIPSAKRERLTGGTFMLEGARITAGKDKRAQEIAGLLAEELNARNENASVTIGDGGNIKLVLGKGPQPEKEFQKREAYFLKVTCSGISIQANQPEGLFYGAATVLNLSQKGKIPAVEIEDYPAMEFRAIHLNLREPGRDRFMEKMIGKVPKGYYGKSIMYSLEWIKNFARECGLLKFNYIVFEGGDKVQWRATTGKHHKPSLTSAQVKELCAYAAKYKVKICPLVASPGHAHWYTSHGREGYGGWGAEGIRVEVENGEVRRDFQSIMDDECNWFNSEYVHLAADETEEAVDFLKRIFDVAIEHGKKAIIWNWPTNKAIRDLGAVNMLWNYGRGYKEVPPNEMCAGAIWSNSAGHGIMGYGDQSDNVYGWARGVVNGGGLGMLTTVWMNYPGPSYEGLWEQIHMAAQASWGPNSKPEDYGLRFSKQFFGVADQRIYDAYRKLYALKNPGRHFFYLRAKEVAEDKSYFNAQAYFTKSRELQEAAKELTARRHQNALAFLNWYGQFIEFHASTILASRGNRDAAGRALELAPCVREGFRNIWGYGMNGKYAIDNWLQVVDSRVEEIE